jgi:hypothetical protein
MKKIIFLSLLTLGSWSIGNAQSKEADLKKLFEILNLEKMMEGVMQGMAPLIEDLEIEYGSEQYEKYMKITMEETKKLMKDILNKEMVPLYDKHFTHSEIKDLIAFFESGTGKKMLEVTPALTSELTQRMADHYLPGFQQELMRRLEKIE